MRIKILGSGAGGGFPQWNCGCSNCRNVRGGVPKFSARTQAQIAVSPSKQNWILVNASPDLRQQLLNDPEFAPAHAPRSTPISAIILTSADVDSVMGLLHLREFQPLQIYATASVRRALTEENTVFRVLERSRPPVRWEDLPIARPLPIFEQATPQEAGTLSCRAVSVGGDFPDYVSDHLRASWCGYRLFLRSRITIAAVRRNKHLQNLWWRIRGAGTWSGKRAVKNYDYEQEPKITNAAHEWPQSRNVARLISSAG